MAPRGDLSAPGALPAARDATDFGRPAAPSSPVPAPSGPAVPAALPTATVVASPPAALAEPASRKRSRKRVVLLTILALVLGGGGYAGYGYWTNGRFMIATDDAYVGSEITILAAKVSGYIAEIAVRPNQEVAAGQVIARIDDVDYRLAVQAAADKLATQRSTIDRIARQVEAAKAQVAQADAQAAAYRADAARAAADYDRQVRLAQSDYATKARLEQAVADRDRSVASVRGADAGLLAAQANVAVLDAQRAEAQRVEGELRTALAKAERDLSFTVVKAPVAGVVGNRAVEVGSYVQPGTRMAALVPLADLHVDANFEETQLGGIK
ncbi:MAG: efflux RND transporter periplasmic adaptor subunit, partial [Methylobacteriaceae bacterium]|nr:efflux RND transporter periplasmic adaptor subunit [Methylobacteriaceae bacterium]